MVVRQRLHHLGWGPLRVDPGGRLDEGIVVALEPRLAPGPQLWQGQLDLLLVPQLGQEVLRADGVRAVRVGFQIGFEPGEEVAHGLDHPGVDRLELRPQRLVRSGGFMRPGGHGALEEANRPPGHADRQVSELLRRVGHVGARGGMDRGDGPLAGDDRPEPLGRGREPAFHQPIDGEAGQHGIEHRVALPDPERLQVEQLGVDLAVEHLGVDRLVEREPRAVERLEAAELVLQFDDPLLDMRTGRVF
jgi:hypothetical protein